MNNKGLLEEIHLMNDRYSLLLLQIMVIKYDNGVLKVTYNNPNNEPECWAMLGRSVSNFKIEEFFEFEDWNERFSEELYNDTLREGYYDIELLVIHTPEERDDYGITAQGYFEYEAHALFGYISFEDYNNPKQIIDEMPF